MKFIGKTCEKNTADIDLNQPVAFNGSTFLRYMNKVARKIPGQAMNSFEIKFRANESNGIMLWMNKGSTLKGDYFVIAMVNGFVEFSYNLGKQKDFVPIRSQLRVDDGKWHVLIVDRKKRLGTLHVDNETPVTGTSNPGATILNTNGLLWIGGSPGLPTGLPTEYYTGFSGCIESVRIDNEKLHLVMNGDNNVQFCSDV